MRSAVALSTCLAPGLVAASPSDEPMPPAESSAPRSAGGPNEGPMPPAESDGYRTAASAPERALPPSESAGYRSAKTKPEPAMPPGETPRRARRRARLPAWMTAVAPRDLDVETSLLVGAFLPAYAHELYDPYSGWRPLARGAVELGARIDYFPVRWLGFEVEGLGIPTRVRGAGSIAVGAVRGGVVLRLPWRIAPLISGGLGALGVSSSSGELGDDVDPAYHVGLGVQAFATRWLIVRLDGRDVLSHRRGVGGGPVHHGELVLAVGARFGPRRGPADGPGPSEADPDHDGVPTELDRCPRERGAQPYGCPILDRDADGVHDDRDGCPDLPGLAPDGCPTAIDDDGDGITGSADRCPLQIGDAPDGCPSSRPSSPAEDPASDVDGDAVIRRNDRCPTQRETRNGYADDDGCPDEMPPEIAELEGVVSGIGFESASDELTPSSRTALQHLADVLQRNPGVRCEIVGHTDNRGAAEANRALSTRRAERVVTALVERGVPRERLSARGAGPDEPLASNASAAGRAINRRVELVILRE
ncbi:MAG: OmpA family protein [Deltaproteobacteria bacterium]|nr:OmpA family protein [Deltaproteobacteria bacterium]MBP7291220.1 OmpA family protein [Nannocystaceae bacterium]